MDENTLASALAPFWRTDDGLTPIERAEAFGIDLSLLEDNLRLTPEASMDQKQAALDLIDALREPANRDDSSEASHGSAKGFANGP